MAVDYDKKYGKLRIRTLCTPEVAAVGCIRDVPVPWTLVPQFLMLLESNLRVFGKR